MQREWNERMCSSSKLYIPINTNKSQWWPLLLKYIQEYEERAIYFIMFGMVGTSRMK